MTFKEIPKVIVALPRPSEIVLKPVDFKWYGEKDYKKLMNILKSGALSCTTPTHYANLGINTQGMFTNIEQFQDLVESYERLCTR